MPSYLKKIRPFSASMTLIYFFYYPCHIFASDHLFKNRMVLFKKRGRYYYANIIARPTNTSVQLVAVYNGKISFLKIKNILSVFQAAITLENIVKLGVLVPMLGKIISVIPIYQYPYGELLVRYSFIQLYIVYRSRPLL